jgi:hypothetical protein
MSCKSRVALNVCLLIASAVLIPACYRVTPTRRAMVPGALDYGGNVDIANYTEIAGWAWARNHPEERLTVDIYDGDTVLGSAVADKLRPDLVKRSIGDGKHGFSFKTPSSLRDGQRHPIQIRPAGTNIDLLQEPVPLTDQKPAGKKPTAKG